MDVTEALRQEIARHFEGFRRVVIWGLLLHTHTHSYIHEGWSLALACANLPWIWCDEKTQPKDMDFSRCVFISEGWHTQGMPVRADCVYFIHNAIFPQPFIDAGARLIDIRFNVAELHDYNNDFVLRPEEVWNLSLDTLYQILHDDRSVAYRRGRAVTRMKYEAVYMYWATDLMPHEINADDAKIPRKREIFYGATIGEFYTLFHEFKALATKQGLKFVHNDPWASPKDRHTMRKLIQDSWCSPDFRSAGDPKHLAKDGVFNGTNHLAIGYVPCRVLKSISYGQTGLTNSKRVKQLLGEHVEYADTAEDVLIKAHARMHDVEWRQRAMAHVASRHTYLHRLRDLGRALTMRTSHTAMPKEISPTCPWITGFMDIGRENQGDGRSALEYKDWLLETLRTLPDPCLLFLDARYWSWRADILDVRKDVGPVAVIAWHELPLISYRAKVEDIITHMTHNQSSVKHPRDVTNRVPEYSLLVLGKFAMMLRIASHLHLNDDDVVAWVDAGISRFFPTKKRFRLDRPNRVKFCAKADFSANRPKLGHIVVNEYIGSNECVVQGGTLTSPLGTLRDVEESVMRVFRDEMLAKNKIDNEQVALTVLAQERPEWFELSDSSMISRYYTEI